MLPQIIVASTCILVTLYGVFRKNRVFFNLGYFVYGLIVVFSDQEELFMNSAIDLAKESFDGILKLVNSK